MAVQTKSKAADPVTPTTETDLRAALTEARERLERAQRTAASAPSPLERLTARRQLPELVAALEVAEYALEEYTAGAPVREQRRRATLIAGYDPEIRRRLVALLPLVEQAARAMAEFQRVAQAADHDLREYTQRYALLAFVPLVGSREHGSPVAQWIDYLRAGGWLPSED